MGEIGDLVRFDFQNFLRAHHKSFAKRAAKCPPLLLIARCQSRGNRENEDVCGKRITEHVRSRIAAADTMMILVPTLRGLLG